MDQDLERSHVPQQNLKNKLRLLQQQSQFPHAMNSSSPLSPPLDKNLLSSNNQLGFSDNLSLSLKDFFMKQSGSDQVGLNLVPLGPFTGYSSILGSSKFLRPAQEVLEDICGGNCKSLELASMEFLVGDEDLTGPSVGGFNGRKSSKLVLMLDEMYRRYKLYCQQVQTVLVSFRSVAGLGNAAPYIGCAIKVVSKYFTCLKNALLDQIRSTAKDKPASPCRSDPYSLRNADSAVTMRVLQNPVWRSQRGLPDQAVAVLKTWLFEHFLHPYPTDSEKQSLAQQTGLSRTQVSNWFINARVRLWKPMVEEVHMLESQQAQVHLHQHSASIGHNSLADERSNFHEDRLPRGTQHHQHHENQPNKRYRSELPGAYNCGSSERNEAVSLALGLHHSSGLDSSWPMPMDMAQHVNLEMIRMMGSASAAATTNAFKHTPNQHFGRDL